MKKILLFLSLCMISITGFCEDVVAYYKSEASTYQIEASEPKNGEFTYYIQVQGEYKYNKVYMVLKSKDADSFKESLNNIKSKYIEWCNVAKSNNITKLTKEFPFKLKLSYAWLGSKWWFSNTYVLTPKFQILNSDAGPQMYVSICKEAKAYDNEYIDQKTYLFLNSAEEIDTLISALDPKKVLDHYSSQKNKESLFE